MKKIFLVTMMLALLAASGCSWFRHRGSSTPNTPAVVNNPSRPQPERPAAIVTPDMSLAAKVIVVNATGHFVILNFPAGQMPKLQQTMYIYRSGVKVAEVLVTGPKTEEENNIVADITTGEPQVGDNVRGD